MRLLHHRNPLLHLGQSPSYLYRKSQFAIKLSWILLPIFLGNT
jgi:hypothetical protein